jgi:beta-1,4-mannosyltransferase
MRVIAFPKSGIAYNDCFYAAVEREGVEVLDGGLSRRWLLANLRQGDWVHLHWPSFGYNVTSSRLRVSIWFARFVALLLLARAKGAQIVWTAHNLLPHDRCSIPCLDVLGRHIVIQLSRLILIHGSGPSDALQTRFKGVRGKLVSIPHGNWIEYYPSEISKEEARSRLDIPSEHTLFLFIGLCKPYKNLHELVSVFRESDLNANLVIAGKFQDPAYRSRIDLLVANDPRIQIREGFIPDGDMQVYLRACDYVVVPYREILTSGTAMLALGFGRPLISADFGFLKDVISENTGILFPHDSPNGLKSALAIATKRRFSEALIIDRARKYSYADAARIFIRSMRRLNAPSK